MEQREVNSSTAEERRPDYETPAVVDLAALAHGRGDCTNGSFDIATCSVGNSASFTCVVGTGGFL